MRNICRKFTSHLFSFFFFRYIKYDKSDSRNTVVRYNRTGINLIFKTVYIHHDISMFSTLCLIEEILDFN